MTFEQLKYFIAAVDENTFFDAAEMLHITQSTLSKQIIKLEKELDISLFDRKKRSASLTHAGKEFYKEALILYHQYEHMLTKMYAYQTSKEQELHIGTLPILSQYQLTSKIKDFTEFHSDFHVILEETEEEALLDGLDKDYYDLIIVRKHLVTNHLYEYYPIATDELVVLLPNTHPLANALSIALSTLSKEPFLLMNHYTSIYQQCMEQFEKYAITPKIVRHARAETILSAVALGEGISLLPKNTLTLFQYQNITPIPLKPSVPLTVVLAKKKKNRSTSSMNAFIQFMELSL